MRALSVKGGIPLKGDIRVGGSKNAALPILFAALTVCGTSVIKNLPDISDVRCALKIIEGLGCNVTKYANQIRIDASGAVYKKPDPTLVCSIRASTYLIGACLSRFGICHIQAFGGCNFSSRPIDFHLKAAEQMGASVDEDSIRCTRLSGAKIYLPKPSVGATVNALIMAASVDSVTEIHGMAREPHILSLIDFLRSAGAKITLDSEKITVKGGKLHDGNVTLIGDMIEAGTYLCAALATGGDVTVRGVCPNELIPLTDALRGAGASVEISDIGVRAYGKIKNPIDIECAPYPAFPTDLQPILASLLSLGAGGKIRDRVFSARFGYLDMLSSFGARYRVVNDTAYIYPPKSILPASVNAPDLRGGAALIIAALAAEGESIVGAMDIIERGYECIQKKLRTLGANVKIKNLKSVSSACKA